MGSNSSVPSVLSDDVAKTLVTLVPSAATTDHEFILRVGEDGSAHLKTLLSLTLIFEAVVLCLMPIL